jgi:hypothetical protein
VTELTSRSRNMVRLATTSSGVRGTAAGAGTADDLRVPLAAGLRVVALLDDDEAAFLGCGMRVLPVRGVAVPTLPANPEQVPD